MNGVILGNSINSSQWVELVSSSGQVIDILLIHDSACDSTVLRHSLQDFSWSPIQKTSYILKTLMNSKVKEGGIGTFLIRSKINPSRHMQFQALLEDLSQSDMEARNIVIPSEWRQRWSLPANHMTAQGGISLIIGNDLAEHFPAIIDSHKKLKLGRSALDGQ